MSKKEALMKLAFAAFMFFVAVPASIVWSVHYCSPQAVWFWCDMLGLCSSVGCH